MPGAAFSFFFDAWTTFFKPSFLSPACPCSFPGRLLCLDSLLSLASLPGPDYAGFIDKVYLLIDELYKLFCCSLYTIH